MRQESSTLAQRFLVLLAAVLFIVATALLLCSCTYTHMSETSAAGVTKSYTNVGGFLVNREGRSRMYNDKTGRSMWDQAGKENTDNQMELLNLIIDLAKNSKVPVQP